MAKSVSACFTSALLTIVSLALTATVAEAADWTARGNEPGWQVQMSDTTITFSTMEGERFTITPVPQPLRADGMQVYSAKAGDDPFTLVVIDKTCSDTMSGMPHPQSVVVAIGDKPLVGCGGEPVSLLLGDWQVAEIGGKPVIAGSGASLTFDLDGSLHGNASCNRFFGSFTLTGEGLAISDVGATLMACEAASMDQEQRFLSALGTVQRFESPAEGTLRLMAADGSAALTLRK